MRRASTPEIRRQGRRSGLRRRLVWAVPASKGLYESEGIRSRGIVNAVGGSYKAILRIQFWLGADACLQTTRTSFERNNSGTRLFESPLVHAWRGTRRFRGGDRILVPPAQSTFYGHTG